MLSRLLIGSLLLAIPLASASADVNVLSQSVMITSRSSYWCGESDHDSVEEEATFLQLFGGLDERVSTTIDGSCGWADGATQLQAGIRVDRIFADVGGVVGADGTDETYGGQGEAGYQLEVVFALTEPTMCTLEYFCNWYAPNWIGGTASASFADSEGTIYFEGSWSSDQPCDSFQEEILLPAGTFTMVSDLALSTRAGRHNGGAHFAVVFPVPVGVDSWTMGMLKARY